MKKILYSLLAVVVLVLCILLFNTLSLTSKQVDSEPLEKLVISDDVYKNLSKAIQYPTISFSEDAIPDSTAFYGFHQFLQDTYPLIHDQLTLEKVNEYSLLYTWKGTNQNKKPIILMSHQDVVPVDDPTLNDWEAGPFEGKITATDIIGRGTLDDKSSLMALMEAVELLLKESFTPSQTIYLAFGHDEEVGGSKGAAKIAALLKERGVDASMTIDEGGFLADGLVPGIDNTVAIVNLAEKGFASFRLIVETNGGHSSAPPKENTIGMLAKAIVDLENNQLPYKLVEPINYQLGYMGAELPFMKKVAFANPWLFKKPILEALNAHTTTAATIIDGGIKIMLYPRLPKPLSISEFYQAKILNLLKNTLKILLVIK
eukprot:TRINITY_DN1074_c0_g1_i10.p2 TRINITY_DN1074_c0_g1~~TRINITY_DN1074_c0_g1_i10.p2  ORF type:complete len:373 (-),score=69.38 TRINITY_DN1074_c0_g1_i10:1892-3010(-)